MISQSVALHAEPRLPPRAALVGLVTPFQEMQQENGQAADQLALFGPAHALDFLGDVFDIRPRQIARAKQLRLLAGPSEGNLIVERAFRGHVGKLMVPDRRVQRRKAGRWGSLENAT